LGDAANEGKGKVLGRTCFDGKRKNKTTKGGVSARLDKEGVNIMERELSPEPEREVLKKITRMANFQWGG